ncbi:hypothetical protein CEXT_796141, partial [Caerostris extrusa]
VSRHGKQRPGCPHIAPLWSLLQPKQARSFHLREPVDLPLRNSPTIPHLGMLCVCFTSIPHCVTR